MVTKVVRAILIRTRLWVLLVSSLTCAFESDIDCLRTIKSQLKDPNGHLSSWEFGNDFELHPICKFNGVTCWHDDIKNRVLNIDLGGFGLEGEFPSGVKECSYLVSLNLTRNNLSGTLPLDIFSVLQYLSAMDLSYNSFSGTIPDTWSNITNLDTLLLDHNRFTGHIPPGVVLNPRLKHFSVAHNHLKGSIPELTNASISLWSFNDNPGLCGFPLHPCSDSIFSVAVVIVAACTAAVFFPVGAAIGWLCVDIHEKQKQRPRPRPRPRPRRR